MEDIAVQGKRSFLMLIRSAPFFFTFSDNDLASLASQDSPRIQRANSNRKKRKRSSTAADEKDRLMCEVLKQEEKKLIAETRYYETAARKVEYELSRMRACDGEPEPENRDEGSLSWH